MTNVLEMAEYPTAVCSIHDMWHLHVLQTTDSVQQNCEWSDVVRRTQGARTRYRHISHLHKCCFPFRAASI